ncbi:fructose-bisphosphate aldolase, partial [Candidatus Woesearchaeota archaeon CG10_big_fil_rev_8_21_14_0_10_47_5]
MNAYYRALRRLFVNGRSLMLAYDQGLEHGPSVFNAA